MLRAYFRTQSIDNRSPDPEWCEGRLLDPESPDDRKISNEANSQLVGLVQQYHPRDVRDGAMRATLGREYTLIEVELHERDLQGRPMRMIGLVPTQLLMHADLNERFQVAAQGLGRTIDNEELEERFTDLSGRKPWPRLSFLLNQLTKRH